MTLALGPIFVIASRSKSGRDPANVADNRMERLSASNPTSEGARLLLIVSAAGKPPRLKLIGKSEVAIGYWTGDAFRVMSGFLRPPLMSTDWPPAVIHWARLAPCLPQEIDLVRDGRFDPDVRD